MNFKYFHLRNRGLHIILACFIGLTLFAYYCTTVDYYHPFVEVDSIRHSSVTLKLSKNASGEASSSLKSNTTVEPTISNFNTSHSQQSLTEPVSLSSSIGPQSPSSASIPVNSLSSNTTQLHTSSLITNSSSNVAMIYPTVANDSVRAIYPPGHDVNVSHQCPNYGKDMNLVIVITSAPSHKEARTAIRQTWGHYSQRSDMSVVFIIGKTKDLKLEKRLEQEQRLYDDIIRGKFVDSYSNLTLKTLSTFEWFNTHCWQAKFLLKTDDDMFINVPKLLAFLLKHEKKPNVIYGRVARKWKPFRSKTSKYYVSPAQYKGRVFPDFATGPAYLLTRDIIEKLYDTAMDQTLIPLEDVFVTGVIAQKLGIKRVHASEFVNTRIALNPCTIQRDISIHKVKYSEQFDLWKKLLDGESKCKSQ